MLHDMGKSQTYIMNAWENYTQAKLKLKIAKAELSSTCKIATCAIH